MEMKMTVTMSDNSKVECVAQFADFVMFERTWNKSVATFQQELRLTDLAWLAWRSQIRLKKISIQFDEWLENVSEIDLDDADTVAEGEQSPAPLD